jgi:hypothetical protein
MQATTVTTSHLSNITITDDVELLSELHGFNDDLRAIVERCSELVGSPDIEAGVYLRKQTELHPGVPMFFNFYSSHLYAREERSMARQWMRRTLELFPDYVIGVADEAMELTTDRKYAEAMELLGPTLRIEERFQGRDVFHEKEVEAYEAACIRYLVNVYRTIEARERLEVLAAHLPGSGALNDLELIVMAGEMRDGIRDRNGWLDPMAFLDKPVFADDAFELKHPEIRPIFHYGARLPLPRIQAILELPHGPLVEELHEIIRFAIREHERYQQMQQEGVVFDDETCFVLHAIMLLGEIPGEKSLEAVLHFYEQGPDVIETFLGGFFVEVGWEPISKLGAGQLDKLAAFMVSGTPDTLAKAIVSDGVHQLAMHRQDQRQEVEQWYGGLFDPDLWKGIDARIEILDDLLIHAADLGFSSLLPKIIALFEKDLVTEEAVGSIEEIRKMLGRPMRNTFHRSVLTIAERYQELEEFEDAYAIMNEDEDDDEELHPSWMTHQPYVRTEPKTGRNDPCPCGSGKKYKKCCLG